MVKSVMGPVFQKKIKSIIELRLTRVMFLVGLFLFISLKSFTQTATISGDAMVCQGSAAPLITFTGAGGIPEYTFTYTINGGGPMSVSTTGGSSIVTLPSLTGVAGTFVYTLVDVTDGNLGTQPATGSVTVVVNALPSVTFLAQPGANTCIGANVTYTTEDLMSNYVWGFPGTSDIDYIIISGGTVTSNTVTVKFLTTTSKTLTINYTNSEGCAAASPTSSIITTVNPLPQTSAIYHQ